MEDIMSFSQNIKLFLGISFLILPGLYAVPQEKSAREMLALGDAGLSITGDVLAAQGGNKQLAHGCRLAGSLCNMASNAYNPYMPKDVRWARLVSDAGRSFCHLAEMCKQQDANNEERPKDYLASGILRLVSLGAEWFALQKEYDGQDLQDPKSWALARLIGSWSRAFADGFSASGYGKICSYFSAMVDSYELMRELNDDWEVNVENNNVENNNHARIERTRKERQPRQVRSIDKKEFFKNMNQNMDVRRAFAGFKNGEHVWTECTICYDTGKVLRKDVGMYLCCGQMACKKCIRRYRQTSNQCPFCRRVIRDNQIAY